MEETDERAAVVTILDNPLQRGDLDRLEAKLIKRFSPPLRPEEVEHCLQSCIAMFESARVQTYVTLLIERAATDRLEAEVERSLRTPSSV
jgi:hypothetical protein